MPGDAPAGPTGPAYDLVIEPRFGRNGDVVLTARLGAAVLHQDEVGIAKAPDRERFVEDLCRDRPGIDTACVRQRLLELADAHERDHARRAAEAKSGRAQAVVRPIEPYQPFPLEGLPAPVARFIRESARAMGCDPAYVALPLLTQLAAAIGNTRRLRLKRSWAEPAVLWAVVAADSGSLKSPALERALGPVHRRQKRMWREYQRSVAEYKAEHAKWKALDKKERGPEPEKPPPCPHLFCADVTVEALADRLEVSPRGVLVAVDELAGWFGSFNQYKAGKGGDVSHYLSMHRAGLLKVDRKTGEKTTIYVPHAAVCVTGGIQPAVLRRVLTAEFFENGLAARLLLAMPPRAPKRWTDADVDPDVERELDDLHGALLALKPDTDVDVDPVPVDLDLTDGAKAAWVAFYDEHARAAQELDGGELAAWSKLEGYAARLALVVHLIRVAAGEDISPSVVDERSVDAGITLSRWFGREAMRVYAALRETDGERSLRETAALVQQLGGRASVRDLVQRRRRYRNDPSAAEADLSALVAAGVGRWETPPPGPRGGRPTRVFRLEEPAAHADGDPVNTVNANETLGPDTANVGSVDVDAVDGGSAAPRERGEL